MKALALIPIAIAISGCFESRTQEQVVSVEKRQGTEGGKVTNLVITRQEQTQAEVKAGVDPQMIASLVEAVKATVPGAEAIAAMIPKPPPPAPLKVFGMDPETLAGAAGALWTAERGVAVYHKRRRLKAETKA